MIAQSPYHEGEQRVQERLGELESAQRNGRAIQSAIMPGALKFIGQQPMAVIGSRDEDDRVWASVLTGAPGFVTAPDQHSVLVDLASVGSHPDDPLHANIEANPRVGMLVIELASRRRLRVNGRVSRPQPDTLRLDVDEAYPNCPKYIQRRHVHLLQSEQGDAPVGGVHSGEELTAAQQDWISEADTFFIASAHPTRGADASHRGGSPGFVRALDSRTLRVPDYLGNSMYNTLGNLEVNPSAGLLFVDFDRGRTLQMTGRAVVRWDLDEQPQLPTGGTGRYWDFTVDRWLEAPMSHPLTAEFLDESPYNPRESQVA